MFLGKITALEEFLYPDSELRPLPEELRFACAANGTRGVQLLLKTDGEAVHASLEGDGFTPEWYRMVKIPVEYNTGDGENQGGSMVLLERPAEKPPYATRLAPFAVYDCLAPSADGTVRTEDGLAALYFCLRPRAGLAPGEHELKLTVRCAGGAYVCRIRAAVYPVEIPSETFSVTNWFSLDAISRFHNAPAGSERFYAMVKKYAEAMRRLRQTSFFMELDDRCLRDGEFHFEHLETVVRIFFDSGMKNMEIGSLLSRGRLPNGRMDMYSDDLKCALAPEIPIDSPEGFEFTSRFVKALAEFLRKNGWQDRALFHVLDEPDIHFKTPEALQARRKQYYLAANILRKYLPGVRTIEAVASPAFFGGVDIMVPGTAGYEAKKEDFDRMLSLGGEVWTYVCCGPEGRWLNRFLDFAVLKSRLLFWGCEKNQLAGYLHWGFNQFVRGMDPYKGTSCPNDTGIGTSFPCGDAFIVYPGEDGPNLGMRFEAQRMGAEDVELLRLLKKKNKAEYDALISRVFRGNTDYDDDPAQFESVYEMLLRALS